MYFLCVLCELCVRQALVVTSRPLPSFARVRRALRDDDIMNFFRTKSLFLCVPCVLPALLNNSLLSFNEASKGELLQ
jgi:hypothetical protein